MKRIFFAAALAVVAIGGAVTANANTYYNQGSSSPINCEAGVASCADQVTGDGLYRLPASNPTGQGQKVDASEYEDLQFIP